ncbi:MAG: GNAT family N-acetyltransferase [Coriobacteriia bacterium]|nr:GNAT family N-acetyltransferase [Coriobacteriia bacterium]MCL2537200.1 GNAT family N-acetyltransferase [Coriobacteriia bacterium]
MPITLVDCFDIEGRGSVELTLVPVSEAPVEIRELVYATLYEALKVPHEPVERWYEPQQEGRFLVARLKGTGQLLGTCRIMPRDTQSPEAQQIRQVVVTKLSQGMGIGRTLMLQAEKIAAAEGCTEMFLWSRYPAYRFYENLGYHYTSEPWISELTKIEHRNMTKQL